VPLNRCRHLLLAQCHSKRQYQVSCWQFSIKEQYSHTFLESLQSVTFHPASCNTQSRRRSTSLSFLQLLNVCIEIQVAITVISLEFFCCTGGPVKGTTGATRMFPCAKEQFSWLLAILTFRTIFSAYDIYDKLSCTCPRLITVISLFWLAFRQAKYESVGLYLFICLQKKQWSLVSI